MSDSYKDQFNYGQSNVTSQPNLGSIESEGEDGSVRSLTLREAERLICGDRQAQYGPPAENFGRIAKLWSGYLGWKVSARDVAVMMVLLKIARVKSGSPSTDTFVDMAGYSALAAELEGGA